jgi:hypothetical protein
VCCTVCVAILGICEIFYVSWGNHYVSSGNCTVHNAKCGIWKLNTGSCCIHYTHRDPPTLSHHSLFHKHSSSAFNIHTLCTVTVDPCQPVQVVISIGSNCNIWIPKLQFLFFCYYQRKS